MPREPFKPGAGVSLRGVDALLSPARAKKARFVTVTLQINDYQADWLDEEAIRRNVPRVALVREALDRLMADTSNG